MDNDTAKQGGPNSPKEVALHFMTTLVEVARESFLILDPALKVLAANPTFYQNFRVSREQTENRLLYELGNGQWNIPELKKLLEDILPKNKVVKDYEVWHDFENIGEKAILLNARQIDSVQLVILALEDITPRKDLERKLAAYTKGIEEKVAQRTAELADRVKELERMNKIMVDREMKMIELKAELEKFKKSRPG